MALMAFFMFALPTTVFAQSQEQQAEEAAEEIAGDEASEKCVKSLLKCVDKDATTAGIEMRSQCKEARLCMKNCRTKKNKAVDASRTEKRDCKSECKGKKGADKRKCKKKCRQQHRGNKKDARVEKRECKSVCHASLAKKECKEARKAFWGQIVPCVVKNAPKCMGELKALFDKSKEKSKSKKKGKKGKK